MSPKRLHKTSFAVYGLLFAILLIASLAGCTSKIGLAPYSIAGRITRASDGGGLDGITVQVSGASGVATTSGGGNWSMAGLTGTVTVTPAGGQEWAFTPSARTVSRSANDVDFIAVPSTPIYSASGRVYDGLGNPIRWVVIEASGRPGIAMTDRDGVWTWDGLSGTTIFTAEAHGWTFSPSSRTVDGPASGVDFVGSRIVMTYSVSGRVTDRLGNPIGGATIAFSGLASGTVTNPDGTWSQSGLSGSVTVTATHSDWVLSPASRIVDGPCSDVDFVGSPPTYAVSGRVCDSLGNPIRRVVIQASGLFGIAVTNANGVWTRDGLLGTVTFTARAHDWAFSPSSRAVDGPASDVDFVGTPTVVTYSVSGRVCDSFGNPIRWVAIEASGHPGVAITDANGVWTWDGLSGTTAFTAEAYGWTFSPSSRVVDGPASDVDFVGTSTAATHSVSGRVCDSLGNPIRSAMTDIDGGVAPAITAADGT